MDQRAQPDHDTVGSSELLLANQEMDTAIPVSAVASEVLAQVVFLDPVDLKEAKWLAIPAANNGHAVLVAELILQKLFLVLARALLTPEVAHTRVVHPLVHEVGIGFSDGQGGKIGNALGDLAYDTVLHGLW